MRFRNDREISQLVDVWQVRTPCCPGSRVHGPTHDLAIKGQPELTLLVVVRERDLQLVLTDLLFQIQAEIGSILLCGQVGRYSRILFVLLPALNDATQIPDYGGSVA